MNQRKISLLAVALLAGAAIVCLAFSPTAAAQGPAATDTSPAADSYRKGAEALEKGDPDTALAHLNRAIELDPKYADAYCDRGWALTVKGELDKAIADLDTAIKLAPNGPRSYFHRGFAYFRKGEYEKAVADYTDAIRLEPKYAEAYRDRGYTRVLMGDGERALDDLDVAVRCRPRTPPAIPAAARPISRWASGTGRLPTTAGRSNWTRKPRTIGASGHARAMKRDFDAGLADLDQAVDGDKDASYRFTRAFAYRKKGDWDKAWRLAEVLSLEPNFNEVYRERGYVFAQKGELDKGLADLDEAVKRIPQDYEARLLRGNVYMAEGRPGAGMADYDEALKLDPAFAEARFHRALARLAHNEPDQALADYKDLIRYDPRTPEGYKDWGTAAGREKRSQAVNRLEAALQAAKAEAVVHSQKGTALHKEKKLDEAIAEYDKALEWYPRYAEVYYNRGLAYR